MYCVRAGANTYLTRDLHLELLVDGKVSQSFGFTYECARGCHFPPASSMLATYASSEANATPGMAYVVNAVDSPAAGGPIVEVKFVSDKKGGYLTQAALTENGHNKGYQIRVSHQTVSSTPRVDNQVLHLTTPGGARAGLGPCFCY